MNKYFNLSRYKELVKLQESNNYSLLDKIFIEWLEYQVKVQLEITYNRRKDYFFLIDQYLSRRIELYEFQSKFLEMLKEDSRKASVILQDFTELERFILTDNLDNFSEVMNQIDDLCFEYGECLEEYIDPMSENEFYYWVTNRYLELQKSVIFSKNFAYEKLISRSFKFLIWVSGSGFLLILNSFNLK